MKRISLPLVLLIVGFMVILWGAFFWGNTKDEQVDQPKTNMAPQAQSPQLSAAPKGTIYTLSTDIDYPLTLPVYSYSVLSDQVVDRISRGLVEQWNIIATPSSVIKGSMAMKSWEMDEKSLLLSRLGGDTTYLYQKPINRQPVKNDLSGEVQKVLGVLTAEVGLITKIGVAEGGPFDGLLILDSLNPAPYSRFSFRFYLGAYAVATGTMNAPAGAFIVDSNGSIRSATISLPFLPINQTGSVSTLTKEQILTSLQDGRGAIVSSSNKASPELSSTVAFTSLAIEKIEVFYAPNRDLLLPALLLSGTGKTGSSSLRVVVFLWGFPGGN